LRLEIDRDNLAAFPDHFRHVDGEKARPAAYIHGDITRLDIPVENLSRVLDQPPNPVVEHECELVGADMTVMGLGVLSHFAFHCCLVDRHV